MLPTGALVPPSVALVKAPSIHMAEIPHRRGSTENATYLNAGQGQAEVSFF